MAEVSIRGATRGDAPRLAALSEVLGYPVTADALAERLGRLLGRDEELVLVARSAPATSWAGCTGGSGSSSNPAGGVRSWGW